ncbi:hypothetical protein RchiOBHm_Chr5g0011111 [Rosa chinensis]|uniref:DUF3475 domain-containing protein n=1 Tax=Rosa chinensis TaxID=74649 RepID=A0A2P6Q4R6_ROSCH|nr:hypothetical protein RchiOBHm_Chr5g0011111 [Rosa chinensis]
MVAESWFRNLWKTKKKHEAAGPEKAVIGILAFEVASLMSKMVHLWRSLSDKKVARPRENISNSEAWEEHCTGPSLKGFEYAISDLIYNGVDPYGWEFSLKMMKIKANRMQKFISVNEDLRDEMKVLLDLEQTLEVITTNLDGEILLDFQQKVEWKRQEVENLKEISMWNNTY